MLEKLFLTDALYKYEHRETPAQFQTGSKDKAFDICSDGGSEARIVFPRTPDNSQQPHVPLKFNGMTKLPTRSVCGWYVHGCETAKEQWNNMRCVTEDNTQRRLEKSKAYKSYNSLPFKLERRVNGIAALWAIRAYFVGPDTRNAPPYVVVLCSDLEVSKWLVDDLSRQLSENYENWYATRLPDVKVLEYGSDAGESAGEESEDDESAVIIVNLNGTYPTMVNGSLSSWTQRRHRCGIRLMVARGSEPPKHGTVGGVIIIRGKPYGLTVGHIFSPYTNDIHTEGNTTHVTAATGNTQTDLASISSILATWQQKGYYDMSLDWALVDLPALQDLGVDTWDNINLVQTVSGDFSPVLVALNEPSFGKPVVLATPRSTYGLRGVFVGSEAVVNIPASDTPYTVWALRMEAPWLIQSGDSGSWVFDAVSGNLLGILVAGCPDLLEAYILPAYQVFNDIGDRFGHPVGLPNRLSLSNDDQYELADLIKSNEQLQHRIKIEFMQSNLGPKRLPIRLWKDVKAWDRKMYSFKDRHQSVSNGPRRQPNSRWVNYHSLDTRREAWLSRGVRFQHVIRIVEEISLDDSPEPASWVRTAFRRGSPMQCHDAISKELRLALLDKSYPSGWNGRETILYAVWDHFILGKDPDLSGSYRKLLGNYSDADLAVIRNEVHSLILYRQPVLFEAFLVKAWDRHTLQEILDIMYMRLRRYPDTWIQPLELDMEELDQLDVGQDDPVLLFGAVILNEDKTHVSVIMPPSSVGPQQFSTPLKEWKGHIDGRLEVKGDKVEYSTCRFPLAVWDESQNNMANMERLFRDQLGLEGVTWQMKKLDWRLADLYYLPRHSREVTIELYEVIVSEDGWQERSSNRKGWPVVTRSFQELEGGKLHKVFEGVLTASSIVK
ncbi:hypothetical protein F5Y06DRAFT_300071 [Hypoxylon sp. FL0890]|nr:hypothetical protein F5Y06DRAFT_300071 [Hypoxylon sp. FL0890]